MSNPPRSESHTGVVSVNLGERSYSIHLSNDRLAETSRQVFRDLKPVHAFVIADQAVQAQVVPIAGALDEQGIRHDQYLVPSGESSKSLEQLSAIWNAMLAAKTDRSSVVVAVGGGVVGDLAGFAAAGFVRGLRFVQVPTTLLAMVDSSVGGKTGINLPSAKNMVGAFWQPSAVVVDTSTLNTLADREFLSGLAEIVKYGVILDPELFEFLEANVDGILARDAECLKHIITRSCRLKADVVEKDERETTGLRAILNYGHTFGHAIEAATQYGEWLHGEAVSIGMTMAAELAVQLGMFSREETSRQTELLTRFRLPVSLPQVDPDRLWALMQHDKKVEQGILRFILPTRLGRVERHAGVTRDQALAAIAKSSKPPIVSG